LSSRFPVVSSSCAQSTQVCGCVRLCLGSHQLYQLIAFATNHRLHASNVWYAIPTPTLSFIAHHHSRRIRVLASPGSLYSSSSSG
jgi:hypothetical protein